MSPILTTATPDEIINSAKIMGTVSMIVVVIFALWSEYFCQLIETDEKENKEFDPQKEMGFIQIISTGAFFIQVMNYFMNGEVRDSYPIYSLVFFGAILLIQGLIQNSTESRLEKIKNNLDTTNIPNKVVNLPKISSQQAPPPEVTKSILWISLGIIGFFAVVYAHLIGGVLLAKYLQLSNGITATLAALSVIAGVINALALHFITAPLQTRKIYRCTEITEKDINEIIELSFKKAKLNKPKTYLLDSARYLTSNAFVTGLPFFKGNFAPSLFVSEKLLQSLNYQEMESVFLHEISHIKLNHLAKRLQFVSLFIIGAIFASVLLVAVTKVFFPNSFSLEILRIVVSGGLFLLAYYQIKQLIRKQEFEADDFAVFQLGANAQALIRSLEKTAQQSAGNVLPGFYPDAKERISALQFKSALQQTLVEKKSA